MQNMLSILALEFQRVFDAFRSQGSDCFSAQTRDSGYNGQNIMTMELPGRKKRRRPHRRFMLDDSYRVRWKQVIH